MNGNNGLTGSSRVEFTNYAPEFFPNLALGVGAFSGIPTDGAAVTTAIARSNPSRPAIQPFTFLFELRDLPRMYKQIGDLYRAGVRNPIFSAANVNLLWQFGIRPLINDLLKLIDFQAEVDKKLRTIDRLHKRGGLRRKIVVFDGSLSDTTNNVTIQSSGALVNATRSRHWKARKWVTIRWIPASYYPKSEVERIAMARRAVLGLSLGGLFSQVWEAIPWSWLIDWFSNVGDFISTFNNAIPAAPTRINVMLHYSSVYGYLPTSKPAWLEVDPTFLSYEEKLRTQSSGGGSIAANLPFLTANQWSILTSLVITRARPPRG
jgi:hypothetical protein